MRAARQPIVALLKLSMGSLGLVSQIGRKKFRPPALSLPRHFPRRIWAHSRRTLSRRTLVRNDFASIVAGETVLGVGLDLDFVPFVVDRPMVSSQQQV